MKPFRTGDLTPISPDAAELIDSAQDCAKKLAACCAKKDAEIERLNGLIVERFMAEQAWIAASNDENGKRIEAADEALEHEGYAIFKKREGR